MINLYLGKDQYAQIDELDSVAVCQHSWCEDNGYAWAKIEGRKISLHEFIAVRMNIYIKGYDIDHQDGDGLNCQRHNLRRATRSQNNHNTKIIKSNTGYRGISFRLNKRKYIVTFKHDEVQIYKSFTYLEEAIVFRNKIYLKYLKEFNPLD